MFINHDREVDDWYIRPNIKLFVSGDLGLK
jgi:hypothetical protein